MKSSDQIKMVRAHALQRINEPQANNKLSFICEYMNMVEQIIQKQRQNEVPKRIRQAQ